MSLPKPSEGVWPTVHAIFGRIVDKADRKSKQQGHDGPVSQRVAYTLLEEASLCDDDLMAEYLGGLLAGSRSPDGRDDRAVAWSRIISGMSWLQIRAHYILYREWAARLHGRGDLALGIESIRATCQMDLRLEDFVSILIDDSEMDADSAIQDAVLGLAWLGLIEGAYSIGQRSSEEDSPFTHVIRVTPTVRGFELYGWAQGLPGLTIGKFATEATVFDTEPAVRRPSSPAFLRLAEPKDKEIEE